MLPAHLLPPYIPPGAQPEGGAGQPRRKSPTAGARHPGQGQVRVWVGRPLLESRRRVVFSFQPRFLLQGTGPICASLEFPEAAMPCATATRMRLFSCVLSAVFFIRGGALDGSLLCFSLPYEWV